MLATMLICVPYIVYLLDVHISPIFEEKENYSLEKEQYKHLMEFYLNTMNFAIFLAELV